MPNPGAAPEFRFYYFTNRYTETLSFYRDVLELNILRSWDHGPEQRGTIFHAPCPGAFIEIEEGPEEPALQGGLYIEVAELELWYARLLVASVPLVQPIQNTAYGHRSFKFKDPNGLSIGFFQYLDSEL